MNRIEINVDDLDRAPEIAKDDREGRRPAVHHHHLDGAELAAVEARCNMERIVTIITIGLIELVAALNIFITLVMMVMEKYRDIAVLMSMGARHSQIRWIFMLQGVLIGVVGSAIGLAVGYTLCYFADKYRWIKLDETVYALSVRAFRAALVGRGVDCGGGDSGELPGDDLSGSAGDHDHARRGPEVRIGAGYCDSVKFTSICVATSTGLPFSRVDFIDPLLHRFQSRGNQQRMAADHVQLLHGAVLADDRAQLHDTLNAGHLGLRRIDRPGLRDQLGLLHIAADPDAVRGRRRRPGELAPGGEEFGATIMMVVSPFGIGMNRACRCSSKSRTACMVLLPVSSEITSP